MSLEKMLEDEKLNNWEGDRGVENLHRACTLLGYEEGPYRYGSPIERFLADNPGAIEKILEFMEEGFQHYDCAKDYQDEEE